MSDPKPDPELDALSDRMARLAARLDRHAEEDMNRPARRWPEDPAPAEIPIPAPDPEAERRLRASINRHNTQAGS